MREVARQAERCRKGIPRSSPENQNERRRAEVATVADEGGHFLHRGRVVAIGGRLPPADDPTGLTDGVPVEVDEG